MANLITPFQRLQIAATITAGMCAPGYAQESIEVRAIEVTDRLIKAAGMQVEDTTEAASHQMD